MCSLPLQMIRVYNAWHLSSVPFSVHVHTAAHMHAYNGIIM